MESINGPVLRLPRRRQLRGRRRREIVVLFHRASFARACRPRVPGHVTARRGELAMWPPIDPALAPLSSAPLRGGLSDGRLVLGEGMGRGKEGRIRPSHEPI